MKIRTDFVTNSSSSSYVTLTVVMNDGNTLETRCDIEDPYCVGLVGPIHLSGEVYESLESGKELLEICYKYASKASNGEEFWFGGDEDEIKSIENIKDEVSEISIETFMDGGDYYMYNMLDSYEFSMRRFAHKNIWSFDDYDESYLYDDDYEEVTYDGEPNNYPGSNKNKRYYYSGTFEDDFYSREVENEVIEKYSKLTSAEKQYVRDVCNSDDNRRTSGVTVEENDNGSQVYESICRFYASEESSVSYLRSIELYTDSIDGMVANYHKSIKYPKMVSEPKNIVCKNLTFVTTYLDPEQEDLVKDDVTTRGGFYRTSVSGKTNVLIVDSKNTISNKFDKAVENIEKGKNTIIITYDHYLKLKKSGNLI